MAGAMDGYKQILDLDPDDRVDPSTSLSANPTVCPRPPHAPLLPTENELDLDFQPVGANRTGVRCQVVDRTPWLGGGAAGSSGTQAAPFVGRVSEFGGVTGRLVEARTGTCRLVDVTGSAGIGKSTLLERFNVLAKGGKENGSNR